jgi:hypothetical protein
MTNAHRWLGTVLLLALLLYSKGGDVLPGPSQSPIPVDGLHVLIVAETSAMTPALATVLNSQKWQSLVPVGNWRILDPDSDMSREAEKWRNAMARPRATLPWVIVSNHPKGGYEGPLLPDQLIALIQQWSVR